MVELETLKPRERSNLGWVLVAAVAGLLLCLPFCIVAVPPISDLPQQLAQIRLLHIVLEHPGGPLAVGWFDPNRLSYLVLQLAWWIGGPGSAGRVTMIFFALVWVVPVFWFARRRGRTVDAAVLASMFFFCHVTYWGFFGFLLGWPFFLLWLEICRRSQRHGARERLLDAGLFFLGGFLLFESHILWWGVACVWLAIENLLARRSLRAWVDRVASQVPLGIWALLWFPTLAREGFHSQTMWGPGILNRLGPTWMIPSFFGGLRGITEPVLFTVLLLWIAATIVQTLRSSGRGLDRDLLLVSLGLFILSLTLPELHTNTIEFASRWAPFALALLLLALPALRIPLRTRLFVSMVLLLGLVGVTASVWVRFDRAEMTGFEEAMAKLPSHPRLLGLDFTRRSRLVLGRPFLQMFAYAQVLHGGGLNFSFADFATSLVRFEPPRPIPWTSGLEWFPTKVKPRDLSYFDYVLVCGDREIQGVFARRPQLEAVTRGGLWRLYRVTPMERELSGRRRSTPPPAPRAGG